MYNQSLIFGINGTVYNNIGYTFIQMEKYDEALVEIEKGLAVESETFLANRANLNSNKGYCLIGLNRLEEAIVYFDKSLEI